LVEQLLTQKRVIRAGLENAIQHAQTQQYYHILELLERAKVMKPEPNYAAASAK
jgi:hypothetical protein